MWDYDFDGYDDYEALSFGNPYGYGYTNYYGYPRRFRHPYRFRHHRRHHGWW